MYRVEFYRNLLEKIKYEWLSFDAYNSFENLKNEIENIFKNENRKYNINFG